MHVTKDIPEMIKEAKETYPDVEFIYTEPLGVHEKLVKVVIERISAATNQSPEDIEKRSFEIISDEADFSDLPEGQWPIVKRVIHATADFEFRKSLIFHPDAIKTGLEAIRAGKDILTDIEMVKTGIIKRFLKPWGGNIVCGISDDEVIKHSKETGKTRAEIAMERMLNSNIGIVAIGNAPTALLKVIDLLKTHSSTLGTHNFPLVVGVPVGFVKAYESKAMLAAQKFPFITNLSRKGGTPVAVAIVNALLKMAVEEQ